LTFYGEVFGCAVQLHTFAEFNRADGPADAIAHGYLAGGPVALFAVPPTCPGTSRHSDPKA
jgi:PhnB protein